MMAYPGLSAATFDRPGGEICSTAKPRPIDFAHLSRQTMGDRSLEQELLKLFSHQANAIVDRMRVLDTRERARLAHGLKGSARAIGAFAVADCAASLEEQPRDEAALDRLVQLVDATNDCIAAISR